MSKKKRKIVGEVELNLDKIDHSRKIEKQALSLFPKHERILYKLGQTLVMLKSTTNSNLAITNNVFTPTKISDVFNTLAVFKSPFFEYGLTIGQLPKIGEAYHQLNQLGDTLQPINDIGKVAKRIFTTDRTLNLNQRVSAFLNTIEMLTEMIEEEYRTHVLYNTFYDYLLNLSQLVEFIPNELDRYQKPRFDEFRYFLKRLEEADLNYISQNEKGLIYPHLYEMIWYFFQGLANFWKHYDQYMLIKRKTNPIQLLLDPNIETMINVAKNVDPFMGKNGKLSYKSLQSALIYHIARNNNFKNNELYQLYYVFSYMLYGDRVSRYHFVNFAIQYKYPSIINNLISF